MRLDTSQHQRMDMRLRMAPRMIQSMEILQLPMMALQERIDQELIENPILVDLREAPASPESETDAEADPASTPEEVPAPEFDEGDDWSDTFNESHRMSRAALSEEADRKHDAMQNMASRPESLHDDLAHQLGYLECDPEVRAIADYLVYNLDDSGFLNIELRDLARDYGGDGTYAQAEEALALVQKLDPPGVGARNLRECLLLQLTPDVPCRDILQVLISNHLDDIQQNRLPAIEKRTGIPIDDIKEAIEHLRRLNPRPGSRYAENNSQYVIPDLIVEANEQGEYVVRLADDHTPQLAISRQYQRMLKNKQSDPVTREFIQKKIQSGPLADRVDRAAPEHLAEGGSGDHRSSEKLPGQRTRVDRTPQDAGDRRPGRGPRHDREPGRGR